MSGNRLEGKVAIVTGMFLTFDEHLPNTNENLGGASGFGAAISTRFAQEGCKVLIADLNESGAQSMVSNIGDGTISMKMDVTQESDWKKAVDLCIEKFEKLDILVNNAGTSYKNKPTLEVTEAEFDRVFNVNVKSIFRSIQVVVPQMKKQGHGGSIINISSIGSVRPRPGLVWYNSSKGAVTNATKGLAAEYGPDQIRVNALAPLLSGTGLFSSFVGEDNTPENRQKFIGNVPLGRLTDPMDVANCALFLVSDEGKFITGVNFEVDGGRAI